jgi:transcription elongation factor Elf1
LGISETLYATACDLSDLMKRHGEKDSQRRLMTFRTRLDHEYQCPSCWMRNEVHSAIVAVPGTERDDKLRCRECGAEYVVPLGV